MEEKKTEFWLTKVWGIEDGYFFGLIKKLNEFFEGKFVIATQIFNQNTRWQGAVYYKEKPKKR